jgi:hypothetical protein
VPVPLVKLAGAIALVQDEEVGLSSFHNGFLHAGLYVAAAAEARTF